MKRTAKRSGLQLKLQLLHPPPAVVPGGKQEELTQALMEQLMDAARKNAANTEAEPAGGRNESEAHA